MTASGAVCPKHPEKHHFGVKVAPSAGVNLNVEASEDDDESEPFLSKAIAVCTPFIPIEFVHGLWQLMILIAPSLSDPSPFHVYRLRFASKRSGLPEKDYNKGHLHHSATTFC